MKIIDLVKKFIRVRWPEILFFLIIVGTYNFWIFGTSYITAGDWDFHYRQLLLGFWGTPSMWESFNSLGGVDIIPSFDPQKLIYGLLSHWFNYNISERVVYFYPILIFSYVSIITLGRKIFKNNNIGILFFGLLFLFNTYALSLQTGFISYAGAYAIAPFTLYAAMKLFEAQKFALDKAAFLSICMATAYFFDSRGGVVLAYMVASYFIFAFFLNKSLYRHKILNGITAFALFLLYVIFTAYPLTHLLPGDIPTVTNLFYAFNRLQDSLTLHNYAWQGNPLSPFHITPFVQTSVTFYFYIIPAVIIAALAFAKNYKKDWKFWYFLIFALLSIFLLKQQSDPFGWIYDFAFHNVPSFALFRESNKFIIFTIGYSIIFGVAASAIYRIAKAKYKLHLIFLPIVVGSIVINIYPILSKNIGTLFVGRQIPSYYSDINQNLIANGIGRSLWVPTTSNFSYTTHDYPSISYRDVLSSQWSPQTSTLINETPLSNDYKLLNNLSSPLIKSYIDNASIRYINVPENNSAISENIFAIISKESFIAKLNAIPTLKRISSTTWLNMSALPYVSTTNNSLSMYSYVDIDKKSEFANTNLTDTSVYHITNDASSANLFTLAELENLKVPLPKEAKYYLKNTTNLDYVGSSDNLKIVSPSAINIPLNPLSNYIIINGDNFYDVGKNEQRKILDIEGDTNIYSLGSNLIANAKLDDGPWQPQVEDCNNFDDGASISMIRSYDEAIKSNQVTLYSQRHSACTGPSAVSLINKNPITFGFRAKQVQGNLLGYQLKYNDADNTVVYKYVPSKSNDWENYSFIDTPPLGATTVRLMLMNTVSEQKPSTGITSFTQPFIQPLENIYTLPSKKILEKYSEIPITQVTQLIKNVNSQNVVENGNFEKGLWKDDVGDCNNHDDDSQVFMKIGGTSNNKKLELSAKSHIACTSSKPLNVLESSSYKFSFKYETSHRDNVTYSISFDDPKYTRYDYALPAGDEDDNNLETVSQYIQTPYGAKMAYISLYVRSDEPSTTNISATFDDFSMNKVSDGLINVIGTNGFPKDEVKRPRVTYIQNSQTLKTIDVKGFDQPYTLVMSETYHPGWVLKNNSGKRIDVNHYKINGDLNAWIIDPIALCNTIGNDCKKDGSDYSYSLTAEFIPQKTFGVLFWFSMSFFSVSIALLTIHSIIKLKKSK